MLAIPRVDLRGGYAVHPPGGSSTGSEVIGDAVSVARGWAHAGFHRVNVFDADAIAGSGSNTRAVEEIIRDGSLDVDVCDAAQSIEQIESLLGAGASRVVVGPRALEEPEWIAGAVELYPGALIVATTVRERRVVTRGWVRSLPLNVLDLVEELNGLALGGLIVEMWSELTPAGADLSLLEDIVEAASFPIIASGGVSSMNDLRALEHRGASAVVIGYPMYSGELDPRAVALEFGE